MNIAYIDKKSAFIKVENRTLRIDEQKIPLRLIDTVVLASSCHLESRDIIKITKEGISILFLSSRGDVAIAYTAESKNAELKLAQFQAQKRALEIAKYLVGEKVKRHTKQLQDAKIVVEICNILEDIEKAESIESLLGIEGSFSRLYFSNFFTLFSKRLHKSKRSKNPPQDPVNAMLSFYYVITYNLITVRLLSFGFEPSIGFLHKPFRSHNALASDFMELFRADINAFVLHLFNKKLLCLSDFTRKNGVFLRYEARKKIWAEYKIFNEILQKNLDKEIAIFRGKL